LNLHARKSWRGRAREPDVNNLVSNDDDVREIREISLAKLLHYEESKQNWLERQANFTLSRRNKNGVSLIVLGHKPLAGSYGNHPFSDIRNHIAVLRKNKPNN